MRFALLIALPLAVLGNIWWKTLALSLPTTHGTMVLRELTAPVQVVRDAQGVPHIEAEHDVDAYAALGYVHAQDRLWQLELQRRMAQGRLAEVLGRDSLKSDVVFRTLDLYGAARSGWPALSAQAQAALHAYTAGVNAWIRSARALPVEFLMLKVEPAPWTVFDSLAWMKVFALNLSGNYQQEINRLVAKSAVSGTHYQALFPGYPADGPVTLADELTPEPRQLQSLNLLLDEAFGKWGLGGRYVGSNAWVVDAEHSATGAPLLANDPHLGLQIPSYWYVASLRGDRLDAAGMTLVGLPIIVFGHNRHIAWGGTNLMADVQDLYVERVHHTDQSLYLADQQWLKFQSRVETIDVRPAFPEFLRPSLRPVQIRVRSTRHGPVISDLVGVADEPLALRWTAFEPGDTTFEAFYQLGYATDWLAFRNALALVVAPALNFVYADTAGGAGYSVAGKIPIRRTGEGSLPVPGVSEEYDWTGYVPPAELPNRLNPASGYAVSANNKPVGAEYPHFISNDWAPPARAQRIENLIVNLLPGDGVSVKDTQSIQQDTVDLSMQRLLPVLLLHEPNDDLQRNALALLRDWNGNMGRQSQAATIAVAWLRAIKFRLFRDELSGFWNTEQHNKVARGLRRGVDTGVVTQILKDDRAGWCDDVSTNETETCDEILDGALNSAIRSTYKLLGDNSMQSWAWGEVHEAAYKHSPFSDTKVLDSVFERRIDNGGYSGSVNAANANFDDAVGYEQSFGASFRMIIEMSPERPMLHYMNSTGQSGNVMSAHYDDMVEPFHRGVYHRLGERSSQRETLTLNPH